MWVFLLLSSSMQANIYDVNDKQIQKMERDIRLLMKSFKSGQTDVIVEPVEMRQKSIKEVKISLVEEKERLVVQLSKTLKEKEKLKVAADKIKNLQVENEKAQKETQRLFEAIILSEKNRARKEAKKRKYEINKKKKELAKIAWETKRKAKKDKALERAKSEKKRINKALYSSTGLLAKIDVSQQKMRVYGGKKLLYSWKVSTGKRGFWTPRGKYKPKYMTKMHYSKKYNNSPMPYAVFFKGGFAIHGTRSVRRLGRPASHGCVRLRTSNAKKFYKLVMQKGRINTLIQIVN
jgi:lipoprotein-anchoring transpeptidase ErfK/SrfK